MQLPAHEILQFVVPCWLINMSLNLIYIAKRNFPALETFDQPLDGGMRLRDGQRLLGSSTTWLGIIVAIIAGLLIQRLFGQTIMIGLLTGLTVYIGHTLGSFIKRRAHVKDGGFLPGVDHANYVITTGIIFGLMHLFPWQVILIGIALTYVLHPIVAYLAYLIGWHRYPL
jgi:hypothetical protein